MITLLAYTLLQLGIMTSDASTAQATKSTTQSATTTSTTSNIGSGGVSGW